jgi:hypothetical protein
VVTEAKRDENEIKEEELKDSSKQPKQQQPILKFKD